MGELARAIVDWIRGARYVELEREIKYLKLRVTQSAAITRRLEVQLRESRKEIKHMRQYFVPVTSRADGSHKRRGLAPWNG